MQTLLYAFQDIWGAVRDVITFKLSFIIPLILFYFIYKTVRDMKTYHINLKNRNKV